MPRPATNDLDRYRRKRDFQRTPEPSGRLARQAVAAPAGRPLFVVQKHAASRLHYDFRLELDGTLKSWAVPKGPSLDPAQKRLAVHVEDHPLEYAEFEGVIPPKQYGAGTVLVWDRGTWEPLSDPREGYRRGVLKFRLRGEKLHGGWTLVRMHRRGGEDEDNWLLIKERDADAKSGPAGEIVETLPDSVASGRGIEQVKGARARVWQSNRSSALSRQPPPALSAPPSGRGTRHLPFATHHASRITLHPASVPGAVKRACPDWIAPQLASLVNGMPAGEGWLHEIKYDGYRIVSRVERGTARLYSRNRNDWTSRLRPQAEALAALGLDEAWLDGEVVVLDAGGKPDFQALQNAFDLEAPRPIVYCLFDLMYLNGYDLRGAPLAERKRLLAALLPDGRDGATLRYSDHLVDRGREVFVEACRSGLEGVIAKRADASYRSGRGSSWLKIKCERRQEFVIGGYTDPSGSRHGFGALLVGYYDGDELRYAGKVGTGFSETSLRELSARLTRLTQRRPPFVNPPSGSEARGVHYVRPQLVAEVRFAEWTQEGILRQPSFQGLRQDKPARAIGREWPQEEQGDSNGGTRGSNGGKGGKGDNGGTRGNRREQGTTVRLSHPDRVLYPDMGLTKEGLARYYEAVAEWIVPHLRGRPLTLVRCPEGYQDCFYQKHINETVPKAIQRIEIEEDDGIGTYMIADSLEAVLGLVQMGVLELHTWGATRDRLEQPDRLTFDLDPDPSVPWEQVIEAAQLTRTLLDELGLVSFVKTTGGKGLHLVTPIERTCAWDEAKAFAKSVADHMARTIPQRFTANMAKRARKGKIFIDYLRNARGATAIAAYSTRAKPGAPVSVPLAWDELSPELKSDSFTVTNVPGRLKSLRADPWEGYRDATRRITERMKRRLAP
ncbi:DNA ligase D [Nitrospira moscoviensis]|uniref:DNA ligase (ATP) n=1 Tax=Nitrospira moscoviensis TaxID=42253 RepID=A0A0K2GDN5_NITMO|nr:DNA ligase D [Nitrospira moscoviensis]ALA59070.1 DNA ligase D [Nitrospira moscoviensis]